MALQRAIPRPKAREVSKNVCMLADRLRLVDERVCTRQCPERDQSLIENRSHVINMSLKGDSRQCMEKSGKDIERLLEADPPPQGSLVPDEVVVQGCGQPRAAVCSV